MKSYKRKGFSLVELMIVVVIMGILVAVAVPLYGAITERAEKNTCQDNQKAIRAVYARYIIIDGTQELKEIFKEGHTSFNGSSEDAKEVFVDGFLDGFEGKDLPKCPVDGNYYTVSFSSSDDIVITCSDTKHKIN